MAECSPLSSARHGSSLASEDPCRAACAGSWVLPSRGQAFTRSRQPRFADALGTDPPYGSVTRTLKRGLRIAWVRRNRAVCTGQPASIRMIEAARSRGRPHQRPHGLSLGREWIETQPSKILTRWVTPSSASGMMAPGPSSTRPSRSACITPLLTPCGFSTEIW